MSPFVFYTVITAHSLLMFCFRSSPEYPNQPSNLSSYRATWSLGKLLGWARAYPLTIQHSYKDVRQDYKIVVASVHKYAVSFTLDFYNVSSKHSLRTIARTVCILITTESNIQPNSRCSKCHNKRHLNLDHRRTRAARRRSRRPTSR
jgi:hypothetical protein